MQAERSEEDSLSMSRQGKDIKGSSDDGKVSYNVKVVPAIGEKVDLEIAVWNIKVGIKDSDNISSLSELDESQIQTVINKINQMLQQGKTAEQITDFIERWQVPASLEWVTRLNPSLNPGRDQNE